MSNLFDDEFLLNISSSMEAKSNEYDWLGAIEVLKEEIKYVLNKRDFLKGAKLWEKMGYYYYKVAYQSDDQEKYSEFMEYASRYYKISSVYYKKILKSDYIVDYCKSISLFYQSFLAKNSSKKIKILKDVSSLLRNALKSSENYGDTKNYRKIYNGFLKSQSNLLEITFDWEKQIEIIEDSIALGRKVLSGIQKINYEPEIVEILLFLAYFFSYSIILYESNEKKKEMRRKAKEYAQKALNISQEMGDSYLISWSNGIVGFNIIEGGGDFNLAIESAEIQLHEAKKTKDKNMIARAYENLAYYHLWKTVTVEDDPDRRREGFYRTIEYSNTAITYLETVLQAAHNVYMSPIESYSLLASEETVLEKKITLQKNAVEIGRKYMEIAQKEGSPTSLLFVYHSFSKALYSLSILEPNLEDKRKILEESSEIREKSTQLMIRIQPFHNWNLGANYNYAALLKFELVKLEETDERKKNLLEDAVKDMECCLKFCNKAIENFPQIRFILGRAQIKSRFGRILRELFRVSSDQQHLQRAITTYNDAIGDWEKGELISRVAETHWQIAKIYDYQRDYSKSAQHFAHANEKYLLAAEKIPNAKAFYNDYALYMLTWVEVENSKNCHAIKKYGEAEKHYEKAAKLIESTKRWSYLSHNFQAWAQIEKAEDASRRDQTEEAIQIFKQAAEQFKISKTNIESKAKELIDREELELANNLVLASKIRQEYCYARISIEEAKILDREGNHSASSQKFGEAAERFYKINEVEQDPIHREILPIYILCKAWEAMTQAESELSSELYSKASNFFEEIRKFTSNEETITMALGHSNFCKALEAGTKFEETRDLKYYNSATRFLESAENYYLKTGFNTASDYASATQHLFDALVLVDKAKIELNLEQKAKYYLMAEKVLQTSAGSYLKAKHPEKTEKVQRLLNRIKDERMLAMSLTDILHAPDFTSSTSSFVTPISTYETAVGLESFEHANIQAEFFINADEIRVGEELVLNIAVFNTGKETAYLSKIEAVFLEGFEIIEKPGMFRVEDGNLNLKGKKLDPLITEEVKIILKPKIKGEFTFNPIIRYLDDVNKKRSHQLESMSVNVRELGIFGWIRGPRTR